MRMAHLELRKAVGIYLKTLDPKSKSHGQKRVALGNLCRFLESDLGRPPLTSDFTLSNCREFLDYEKTKCAASTVNVRVAALRTFGHAWAKHFDMEDFTSRIRFEERVIGKPRGLSFDEEAQVVKASKVVSNDPFKRFRDQFFVQFLFATGLRCNEALSIRLGDITLQKGGSSGIRVTCKGGKRRFLVITKDCYELLDWYLAGRAHFLVHSYRCQSADYVSLSKYEKESIPLIINTKGNVTNPNSFKLRYENIRRLFQKISKLTGFHVTAHDTRHTLGVRLAENNVPVPQISQILGHSDTKTTMRYIQSSEDTLIEALEGLSKKNIVQ